MKFVNDLNISLAWKVVVEEVLDSLNNYERTDEWGIYAYFAPGNICDRGVLVKKFASKDAATNFKEIIQRKQE